MSLSTFDSLTQTLNDSERKKLLAKIGDEIKLPPATTKANSYIEEEYVKRSTVKECLHTIPPFQLFILRVKSFFSNNTFENIVKDHLINDLKTKIVSPYSDWVDFKKDLFLKPSYDAVKNLSESIKVFKLPLDIALVTQKKYFYAFLGGEVLGPIHEELLKLTNYEWIYEQCKNRNHSEVRTFVNNEIKIALDSITKEQRFRIKTQINYFTNLQRLVNFSFERITSVYNRNNTCQSFVVINQLTKFSDILFNLTIRPNIETFSHLFTFDYYNSKEEINQDLFEYVKTKLTATGRTLEDLQQLINFPLNYIIKIFKKDYFFEFLTTYNGDEWFNLYQKFWQERLDTSIKVFLLAKGRDEVEFRIKNTLILEKVSDVPNYNDEEWDNDVTPIYTKSLSYINAFFLSGKFASLTRLMQIIENEGTFEWPENRTTLLSLFTLLKELHRKKYKKFESSLAEGSDFYSKLFNLDYSSTSVEERFEIKKQHSYVADVVNRHARELIDEFIETTKTLFLILTGLIRGSSADSRFSRLSNLAELDSICEISKIINNERLCLKELNNALTDLKNIEERFSNKHKETQDLTLPNPSESIVTTNDD